jgi:hypothetical protein
MTTPQTPAVSAEDQVLDYTQEKRMRIVEEFIPSDGKPITQDLKLLALTLQAMDGMDRAALGKKKIKVEEEGNKTQEQAAGLIAEILAKANSISHGTPMPGRQAPSLPPEVGAPTLIAGETDVGPRQRSYDEFTAGMQITSPAA